MTDRQGGKSSLPVLHPFIDERRRGQYNKHNESPSGNISIERGDFYGTFTEKTLDGGRLGDGNSGRRAGVYAAMVPRKRTGHGSGRAGAHH